MSSLSPAIPLSLAGNADKAAAENTARRISSTSLLAGEREIIVEHRGDNYRLRLTANGKLILTK